MCERRGVIHTRRNARDEFHPHSPPERFPRRRVFRTTKSVPHGAAPLRRLSRLSSSQSLCLGGGPSRATSLFPTGDVYPVYVLQSMQSRLRGRKLYNYYSNNNCLPPSSASLCRRGGNAARTATIYAPPRPSLFVAPLGLLKFRQQYCSCQPCGPAYFAAHYYYSNSRRVFVAVATKYSRNFSGSVLSLIPCRYTSRARRGDRTLAGPSLAFAGGGHWVWVMSCLPSLL